MVQAVKRDYRFNHRHNNFDGSTRKETKLRVINFSGKDRTTNISYAYQDKFAEYLDGWGLLDGNE